MSTSIRPKPTVILVHGMWSNFSTWAQTPMALRQAGYEVLHYELPQHGGRFTDPDALACLGIQDYVADLVAVIESLPMAPILVGHSMGGLIALLAAARTQVHRLMLVSPAAAAGSVLWTPMNLIGLLRSGLKQLFGFRSFKLNEWEAKLLLCNDMNRTDRLALMATLQLESGKALLQIAFWPLDRSASTRMDWPALRCPVRLYLGGRDRLIPAYALRRLHALADFKITTDRPSGHMVFNGPRQASFTRWLQKQIQDDQTDGHTPHTPVKAGACAPRSTPNQPNH